jgi:hypothetical protein
MIKPSMDVIQKRIFLVRNTLVMLDIDMAWLYGVNLQDFLNLVVKEIALPNDFLLRLNADECPSNSKSYSGFFSRFTRVQISL